MVKHISKYVVCIVLMLLWSLNVYAADEVTVSFNHSNGDTINLSTDNTILTVTANNTSVTDFDVYINGKYYQNIAGSSANVELKALKQYGMIHVLAYANDATGVVGQNEVNVLLKEKQDNYFLDIDMQDFVEIETAEDFLPGTNGRAHGGYLKPVEIDAEHGKSLAFGSTPALIQSAGGFDTWFGCPASARTDITSIILEFDAQFSGAMPTINIMMQGKKADGNAESLWLWQIKQNMQVNGANITAQAWHHFKYVFDLSTDKHTLWVDNYKVINNATVSNNSTCLNGVFRVYADMPSAAFELVLDNIKFYQEGITPVVTGIVDSNNLVEVAYTSEYARVTLTDAFGDVAPSDFALINTNGEQKVANVIVDESNAKVVSVYPKNGFMPGEEYYLVIKKDTPAQKAKIAEDTYYRFNTSARAFDVVGGAVVKKNGKLEFTAKISNSTGNPVGAYLIMYIMKDGAFSSLCVSENISVPDGADGMNFSLPAVEMPSGGTGYGFVVTDMTNITPVSNKLFVSKSY